MSEYITPLMQQFAQLKREYPDCLLLFRLGDFYELFEEDAKIGSEILDITLTRKAQSKGGDIPMAGIPYHALDSYLETLVENGYKVAIAEQVGEVNGRTLVERKVVRIVTPGTILSEQSLRQKENNFLAAFTKDEKYWSLAYADLSTGQLFTAQQKISDSPESLRDQLAQIRPAELLLPPTLYNDATFLQQLQNTTDTNLTVFQNWEKIQHQATELLHRQLGVRTLQGFGIAQESLAQATAAVILQYIEYTQRQPVQHFRSLQRLESTQFVILDQATVSNLELFRTLREGKKQGSVITHLDHTVTPMGGRLLRQWLRQPLRNHPEITARLDAVEWLKNETVVRKELREVLTNVGDIERLLAKLSVKIGTPRDLARLRQSLQSVRELVKTLTACSPPQRINNVLNKYVSSLEILLNSLEEKLAEMPPVDISHSGIIRESVDSELDQLRQRVERSQEWMLALEDSEKQATKIPSLKIRNNKVFGFYIEVSKSYVAKVPAHYQRKQTLVNAERFFTEDLKREEELLVVAEQRAQQLEQELFASLIEEVIAQTDALQQLGQAIASLDCFLALAELAEQHHYVRPTYNDHGEIIITAGRHPVVETLLSETPFVPNDTHLDTQSQQLHILTGPNMAGKSVYIRQVALITLLAHLGSFVPAQSATICLVDRIFARSGASDIITAGLSTFMVEMVETAHILRHATTHSLIIMDEIGRGTSTYDGISIAWSVAEYLATSDQQRAKTLFATHYHELQGLADQHLNIQNYQVLVEEHEGEPIFLHVVKPGGASHSFGVAVAKLAGVPAGVTNSAEKKLAELEQGREGRTIVPSRLGSELEKLDLTNLTPLQALQLLHEWKEKRADE